MSATATPADEFRALTGRDCPDWCVDHCAADRVNNEFSGFHQTAELDGGPGLSVLIAQSYYSKDGSIDSLHIEVPAAEIRFDALPDNLSAEDCRALASALLDVADMMDKFHANDLA